MATKAAVSTAEARRRVIRAFLAKNGLKVQTWAKASGVTEGTVRAFLAARVESMSDRSYAKLAAGASKLLEREVHVAALKGERPPEMEMPVRYMIGAGDEIHVIEEDSGFDYTVAPPGFEHAGAGIVRGDSMRPLFEEGDILFWREVQPPPSGDPPQRAVIVHLTSGVLYVKRLLAGTRKGRFHLLSVNPITPILADQHVEAIAQIEWVKPRLK